MDLLDALPHHIMHYPTMILIILYDWVTPGTGGDFMFLYRVPRRDGRRPWPWNFKINDGICYIPDKNGSISTQRKAILSIQF